jgi:hypothetical protein
LAPQVIAACIRQTLRCGTDNPLRMWDYRLGSRVNLIRNGGKADKTGKVASFRQYLRWH